MSSMYIDVLADPHALSKKLDYVEDVELFAAPNYYRAHYAPTVPSLTSMMSYASIVLLRSIASALS